MAAAAVPYADFLFLFFFFFRYVNIKIKIKEGRSVTDKI